MNSMEYKHTEDFEIQRYYIPDNKLFSQIQWWYNERVS